MERENGVFTLEELDMRTIQRFYRTAKGSRTKLKRMCKRNWKLESCRGYIGICIR